MFRAILMAVLPCLVTALAAPGVAAQDVAVPVEVQVPLFLKILSFDRSLGRESSAPLVMGVLYQGKFRASADVADQVRRAVKGGVQLQIVPIDLDQTDDVGQALARRKIQVLYVSPLRAIELRTVADLSRKAGVRTLTGVPRYVEGGLGIGIDLKGGRPEIVVNLAASRAEGGDLDAQLLKLARIVD